MFWVSASWPSDSPDAAHYIVGGVHPQRFSPSSGEWTPFSPTESLDSPHHAVDIGLYNPRPGHMMAVQR